MGRDGYALSYTVTSSMDTLNRIGLRGQNENRSKGESRTSLFGINYTPFVFLLNFPFCFVLRKRKRGKK